MQPSRPDHPPATKSRAAELRVAAAPRCGCEGSPRDLDTVQSLPPKHYAASVLGAEGGCHPTGRTCLFRQMRRRACETRTTTSNSDASASKIAFLRTRAVRRIGAVPFVLARHANHSAHERLVVQHTPARACSNETSAQPR